MSERERNLDLRKEAAVAARFEERINSVVGGAVWISERISAADGRASAA